MKPRALYTLDTETFINVILDEHLHRCTQSRTLSTTLKKNINAGKLRIMTRKIQKLFARVEKCSFNKKVQSCVQKRSKVF